MDNIYKYYPYIYYFIFTYWYTITCLIIVYYKYSFITIFKEIVWKCYNIDHIDNQTAPFSGILNCSKVIHIVD